MLERDSLSQFLQLKMPVALDMLRRMVEVNSFTGNSDGVNRLGRLTAESFNDLGFSPEFVPSTNPAWGNHLVLTRPGTGRHGVAMISHLDTVFPPEEEERNNFRWQIEGDRIYGPGTQDIKGGTVMMWLVLSALQRFAPAQFAATTWKLFLNSSEEQFSPDFGDVCLQRFSPSTLAALVFEAEGRRDNTGLLVLARKGRATWRVTVAGRGAHAGGKHPQGANAIVQIGKTARQIADLTDYAQNLTFNPATIRGGTVLNRVPHEAVLEGEFRAFTPEVYAQAKSRLLALAGPGDVASPMDGHRCGLKVEILTESRPWPRNPATDRLFTFWATTAKELGIPLGSEERGGLSDGNLVWDAVPTLDGLGPWGDNDHCSERSDDGSKVPEYVAASSYLPKAMLNTAALVKMLQNSEAGC